MARDGNSDFATITPAGTLPKVTSIFDFSANALAELRLWLEQNPPAIGISNILGFARFTANIVAPVGTAAYESTTSASFANLATAGPELTGLSDGAYLVLFGTQFAYATAGDTCVMSVGVNGDTTQATLNARACGTNVSTTGGHSIVGVCTVTLSGGNGKLTAKYRNNNNGINPANFLGRWLIALKYANA